MESSVACRHTGAGNLKSTLVFSEETGQAVFPAKSRGLG